MFLRQPTRSSCPVSNVGLNKHALGAPEVMYVGRQVAEACVNI